MTELSQSARPLIFIALLVVFASWEYFSPRRRHGLPRCPRWTGNLGILVTGTLVARVLLPIAPISVALWAASAEVGLLHAFTLPDAVSGLIAFLVLDLTIYAQHVAFHKVPLLWRVHRMHHSDLDLDASTGLRFHPIEIVLSLILKMAVVALLGAPALAVLIFEIVLNATSMFNHASIKLPGNWDRVLRLLVVTPDMHRVHHSIHGDETDSNFGFNIPWWDRLFRTYRPQPRDGHEKMTLGLPYFRDARSTNIISLLVQPFLKEPSAPANDTVRTAK